MDIETKIKEAAQKVADTLRSSVGNVHHALKANKLPETLEDDLKFCAALDDLVFECNCCNWWCDVDEKQELFDELICQDCASE